MGWPWPWQAKHDLRLATALQDGGSAAISALASLTEIEKDKLNEARLESLDHYLDELQRRAEEARQSHDYYEGVDDLTPAVDAASQYDIREIDEDLRIGALASALATPKARA